MRPRKNGKYFLYFPAKDKQDVFRIGVAVANSPDRPVHGGAARDRGQPTASTPPCSSTATASLTCTSAASGADSCSDGRLGSYVATDTYPGDDQPALTPKIARLKDDMLGFAETPRNVVILDEHGKPLTAG